jgi:hypothetical protein
MSNLPTRLRAMHATQRWHFTPPVESGKPQVFSILASAERFGDLLLAADALEAKPAGPCDMGDLCIGCTPRMDDGSCPAAAQSVDPEIPQKVDLKPDGSARRYVWNYETGRLTETQRGGWVRYADHAAVLSAAASSQPTDESDMLTIAHLDGSARADDRWRRAIREAAIREFAEWREHTSCSETVITGIRHLCERLGVKL